MDRRNMIIGSVAAAMAAASTRLLAQATQGANSSQALNTLFDQFMKEDLDLSPTSVTSLGLDTGARAKQKSEIDDSSEASITEQKRLITSQLKRLKNLDRSKLSKSDAISYDVVLYGLQTKDDADAAFNYGPGGGAPPYILSQLNGNYQQLPSFLDNEHSIETKSDADAYLARLKATAVSFDQEIECVRHDMALGVTPPDFALAKTLIQMQALRAPAAEKSSLVESVVRRTKAKGIAGDYAAQATAIISKEFYPALDRQIAVVREMQKGATHDAGIWRLPQGADYYTASLLNWATTNRKPEDIHQLGLDLVKDHTGRIDALMRAQGITGGTVGERLRVMYTDPKFQYANTDAAKEQLLSDLNGRVQRVRAKLPKYFQTLPKADVVIKRVPKEIEAGAPGGYYQPPSLDGKRPGMYWINLRNTAEQPKWTLPTLTYHESIPGHHLQGSIQQEANLPLIRKVSFYSAYIEGWALYAEQLAAEMGEYDDDPLGHIGQLHDSMFRAVRLVVDTGIHNMKWSREKAIKYFVDNLGDKQESAVTEVERYCVWPGQACTYMLGKLKFLAEREKAQKTAGANFSIRKFHDQMLLPGAVPLDLLDRLLQA
jgi:uncharacterized protein (DUF885 family)